MTFNRDRHHRRSIRLNGYDYAQAGAYFVTLCAHQRACLFGEIVDGEMQLNDVGEMVASVWSGLPAYYACVAMDEFVVMPNHLHGIVVLSADPEDGDARDEGQARRPAPGLPLQTMVRCPLAPSSKDSRQ